MFFEFPKENLIKIGLSVAVLFFATAVFVVADNRFNLLENAANYADRKSSDFAYFWLHKSPLEDGLSSLAAVSRSIPFFSKLLGNKAEEENEVYAASRERAISVPVLIYHGAPPEGNDNDPLPVGVFVEQMEALQQAGWKTITMEEFRAFVKEGKPLPDRSFLLTFDDGRKESFYPVDPVLKDLGFNAIMFVITAFSIERDELRPSTFYLSETELRYMAESGRWELESHGDRSHSWYAVEVGDRSSTTIGHFFSNKFSVPEEGRFETDAEFRERVRKDMERSKQILENTFGREITAFAFPFSDFGQDTKNFPGSEHILIEEVSKVYPIAFYQTWNANGDTFNYPDANQFMIRRIEPLADWSGKELLDILESGRARELPLNSSSFGIEWLDTWGEVKPLGDRVSFEASTSTTGAAGFLNGSGFWQDYLFTATFEWKSGQNVSLMTRYRNNSNYLACAYSDGKVSLQENTSGARRTIATAPWSGSMSGTVSLTMGVRGRAANCYAGGERIVGGALENSMLEKGGIGIQIWDRELGKASIDLTEIDVRPI